MRVCPKSIVCPQCRAALTVGVNLTHADDLSLVCGKCSKVVFPVTQVQEDAIPKYSSRSWSRGYATEPDCDND